MRKAKFHVFQWLNEKAFESRRPHHIAKVEIGFDLFCAVPRNLSISVTRAVPRRVPPAGRRI